MEATGRQDNVERRVAMCSTNHRLWVEFKILNVATIAHQNRERASNAWVYNRGESHQRWTTRESAPAESKTRVRLDEQR